MSDIEAGVFNTHHWIDPARRVAGVLTAQAQPFGDARTMKLRGRFEGASMML